MTKRLAVFLAAMMLAEASRTMTMVQIPVFLREMGADIAQVGAFFTVSLVFSLLLRAFGGWLSDAFGRLRALTLGSFAGVLAYVAYALAPSWQLALLGPAFMAVTIALTFPSYRAYVADHTRADNRGRVFGISETTITLAWIFGPPLGGLLAQNFGYRVMFAGAALSFGLATAVFLLIGRNSSEQQPPAQTSGGLISLRGSLREMLVVMAAGGLVTWILITDGVRDIAAKMSFDLMPVYLSDIAGISKQGIGLLDGIFGIALAAASYPAGWLVDKTSERVGVVLGIACMVASRLVFALASGFWGFAFSWIILGIGAGVFAPAQSSLIARGVPRRLRGITFGLVATSQGLVSLPFPWIGSLIWKRIDPRAPFLMTVVLGSLAIVPSWFKLVVPADSDEDRQSTDPEVQTGSAEGRSVADGPQPPAPAEGPVQAPQADLSRPDLRGSTGAPKPHRPLADALTDAGPSPGGELADATVLFAGLLSHTPAEQQARVDAWTDPLQGHLSGVKAIIVQHGGIVDGIDAASVLAAFGTPPRSSPPQVNALLATHAALSLLDFISQLNEQRASQGLPALSLGVGIHTGPVTARLGGGPDDPRYTLSGDTIMTTRHLQRFTGAMKSGGLLISENTYAYLAAAHEHFTFGRSGPVQLPGGGGQKMVHEVLGRTRRLVPNPPGREG
jgi:MFS family permease/class 3 adenylate cyclase